MEYYFKDKKDVIFFWKNGVDVSSIEKYYDDIEFVDWIYVLLKVLMLKV